jgi:hypothetical protein
MNYFPDHPVNVVDYFHIITILLWAIRDSCEQFSGPFAASVIYAVVDNSHLGKNQGLNKANEK